MKKRPQFKTVNGKRFKLSADGKWWRPVAKKRLTQPKNVTLRWDVFKYTIESMGDYAVSFDRDTGEICITDKRQTSSFYPVRRPRKGGA